MLAAVLNEASKYSELGGKRPPLVRVELTNDAVSLIFVVLHDGKQGRCFDVRHLCHTPHCT